MVYRKKTDEEKAAALAVKQATEVAVVDAAAPVTRKYLFRANAKAGRAETGGGIFNGTCMVYEGDEFFMIVPPATRKVRGPDGKLLRNGLGEIQRVPCERALPTWADVVDEYPLDTAPKPLRFANATVKVAGGPVPMTGRSIPDATSVFATVNLPFEKLMQDAGNDTSKV